MTIFEQVHQIVATIPRGKVMTYGQIGKLLGITPRVVGFALHANKTPDDVPCHRVVNRDGRVAPGYAFGGYDIQKKLLEAEDVEFKDELCVNLTKHLCT
jgi:methylated-DNA-protein-cysteine methyltransferase related protein